MQMEAAQQIEQVLASLTSTPPDRTDAVQQLAVLINDCIEHDFEKLVQVLYRVDVDEKKVKQALQQNSNTDAGIVLAQLLIERHLQKVQARQAFGTGTQPPPEEERW